jgi:hypothetical protein
VEEEEDDEEEEEGGGEEAEKSPHCCSVAREKRSMSLSVTSHSVATSAGLYLYDNVSLYGKTKPIDGKGGGGGAGNG